MTKERRQFLTVSSVAGAGLPRELLVDESTGRVYCATANQPAGVGQALQSEVDSLNSRLSAEVARLDQRIDEIGPSGEGHWSHYSVSFQLSDSDWIHIDNHPNMLEVEKQDFKAKGYYYFTTVAVNSFGSEAVSASYDYFLEVASDEFLTYMPMFKLMTKLGSYVIGEIYSRAPVTAVTDFAIHFANREDYSVAELNEVGTQHVYVKCRPINWELVQYEGSEGQPSGYYWHSLLTRQTGTTNPFTVATCPQGKTLQGMDFGIYSECIPYQTRTSYFGGWFAGQGSRVLQSDAEIWLSATQGETVPPVGYYCTLHFTVNVTNS